MHVKTDVFCSASLILPDKGARQINVGGWSVDSLYGIRLYTPDGSPGVNGTNDWEENGDELKLQVDICITVVLPILRYSLDQPSNHVGILLHLYFPMALYS